MVGDDGRIHSSQERMCTINQVACAARIIALQLASAHVSAVPTICTRTVHKCLGASLYLWYKMRDQVATIIDHVQFYRSGRDGNQQTNRRTNRSTSI